MIAKLQAVFDVHHKSEIVLHLGDRGELSFANAIEC